MRRFGDSFRADKKYIRRPGAYAIIVDGPNLLLTLQDADELELQLPGGGIDPGETPLRALHREVLEETGYHVAQMRRLGAYQRYTYMPEYEIWAHKICHIFVCRPTLRISEPLEPEHAVVWMKPSNAIEQLSNSGDRYFTQKWLDLGR